MKTKIKIAAALICAMICAISFAGCNDAGKCTLLGSPKTAEALDYDTRLSSDFISFKESAESFASDFAAYTYEAYDGGGNFAVSPISVFMGLALAAECTGGGTRAEILSAMGVTYEELKAHISSLYRLLTDESKSMGKVSSMLKLTNSIWVNEGLPVKKQCIDALANDYFCYSYSADFRHDNGAANKAVRNFVKKQTKGLIDQNFNLNEDVFFALINTLYLKTVWDMYGDDLPFAKDSYTFTAKDGSKKQQKLLLGDYNLGRVYEDETFSAFFTSTYDGYKIKFILPKDGYSVDEVFTAENIAKVNAIKDYREFSDDKRIAFKTRCLFPEYKCAYNENVAGVLKDKFGIELLFKKDNGLPHCEFSSLTDEFCFCDAVSHAVNLTVDKKGIEGAAVTVFPGCGNAGPIETVYADFVIDRAFGFIITGSDVTLFSGVVSRV